MQFYCLIVPGFTTLREGLLLLWPTSQGPAQQATSSIYVAALVWTLKGQFMCKLSLCVEFEHVSLTKECICFVVHVL